MSLIITNNSWSDITGDDMYGATMSRLLISAGDVSITENSNIWSKSIEQTILVSSAPLAMWFLQNWWRLLYEPFQAYSKGNPGHNWRMAHELGAANHGYVWPRMAFFSDLNSIYIASVPTNEKAQSVRYLNRINGVISITLTEFEHSVKAFLNECIDRISSLECEENTIKEFLEVIEAEKADPKMFAYRKIEAMLGFDPDEASAITMAAAMRYWERDGAKTIEELAPVFGKYGKSSIKSVDGFLNTAGIFGNPDISLSKDPSSIPDHIPWKLAVRDARDIRKQLSNDKGPLDTKTLFELLGVDKQKQETWDGLVNKTHPVSVGIRDQKNGIKYLPRKQHPFAKRFELGRFLGDFLHESAAQWLVSTDMGTARQKYQKAFSAALLCPIERLIAFLDNDYSDEAVMGASEHFGVSQETVTSVLNNNGYGDMPYRLDEIYTF